MLYTSAVHIAALFSKKVAKMVKGDVVFLNENDF